MGCYIWYSVEELGGAARAPPPCTKCNSPPINGQCTNHLYNGPLLCGFNVLIKWSMVNQAETCLGGSTQRRCAVAVRDFCVNSRVEEDPYDVDVTCRRRDVEGSVAGHRVEAVWVGAGVEQTAAEVGGTPLCGRQQCRHSAQTLVDVVVQSTGTGSRGGQLTDERDVIARDGVVQLADGTSLLLTLIDACRVCDICTARRQKHRWIDVCQAQQTSPRNQLQDNAT